MKKVTAILKSRKNRWCSGKASRSIHVLQIPSLAKKRGFEPHAGGFFIIIILIAILTTDFGH